MKICPKCGGKRFYVTVHIAEDWIVDENEEWVDTYDACVDVIHRPDDSDLWECVNCGYDDVGSKFNA